MLSTEQTYKPSHDEWLHCAQVVIDRLSTCVHIYSHPPYDDAFIADKERQDKNSQTLNLLRRVYSLVDGTGTPTDSLADVAHHDERVIAGLNVLMNEVLSRLPEISADMQHLLKSPWFDKCNGRLASELFRGPMGNEPEGIGSGHVEHGRLPEVIHNLLEREQVGVRRQPRQALHRASNDRRPVRASGDIETLRRWTDVNSQQLRIAGRVE